MIQVENKIETFEPENELEWLKNQIQKENYNELKSRFKIVEDENSKIEKPLDFTWVF